MHSSGLRLLRRRACLLATGVALSIASAFASAADPSSQPAGPMAVVADSSVGGATGGFFQPGQGSAMFFVVEKVDGVGIRTAVDASRSLSFGLGPRMRTAPVERPVPAGKVKLSLSARVAFAAPIDSIFRGGRSPHAEGEIEVVLRPGVRYRVTGVLETFRREVWLEEEETHEIVGRKISMALDPKQAAELAAADHFVCCNLRYEEGWISDAQPIAKPFMPAGARVRIKSWGKDRVEVTIEGQPFSAAPYHGHFPGSHTEFAGLLFVKEDPAKRLEAWPPDVQSAVLSGRVRVGMTREQVVMALGYPRMDRTESLDSHNWSYYAGKDLDEFDLEWSAGGTLVEVNAPSRVKALVVSEP